MHTGLPFLSRAARLRRPEQVQALTRLIWRVSQAAWIGIMVLAMLPAVVAGKAPTAPPASDPVICDSQRPDDQQDPDCVDFGAAVGTLGLGWRQQLPAKVRWLMRRDASELCQQARNEFGERTSAPLRDGCIFISAQACTIVTLRPAAPAELGNAVRNCQP